MSKFQKQIVESSKYNLLNVALGMLLGQISTFAIARLITPGEWGFLLLSLSIVNLVGFFGSLIPPGGEGTIYYYIPQLKSLGEDKDYKIRKFMFHFYKLRIIGTSIGYISFLFIIFFSRLDITLLQITLILSPKIILTKILNMNHAFFMANQKFKLVFIINILMIFIISIGNIALFFLKIEQPLIYVTYVNLFSSIIPFILSIFFLIPLIPKKQEPIDPSSYDLNFYKLHKTYGLHLVLTGIFAQISAFAINLLFLNFGFIAYITYILICDRAVGYVLNFSSSNKSSYLSIFSEINYQKNPEKFRKLFYQLYKYLSLFVCLFTAILLYFMEAYITIIYSEIYLSILFAIQIYLFHTFSRLITRNLFLIIGSTNHNKIVSISSIIQMFINVLITFIGVLFFDFITLIILYLIASYLLNLIIMILISKIIGFKPNLLKFYFSFILFLICNAVVFPLRFLIDFHFFSNILMNSLLNSVVLLASFFIIFYLLIYLTKFITREEFKQLVNLLPILNLKYRYIQKLVKIMGKFFPPEKNMKKNNRIL